MTTEEFKNKYFNNNFYWVNENNFELIQEIALDMGLTWHTGDTEIVAFSDSWKNLWMSPEGFFQGVPFFSPCHSYGEPVNMHEMKLDYHARGEGLTEQYKGHAAKTDKIVETLKELVLTNRIMHDGLSEAQTMIGERDLIIMAKDKEIEQLRYKLSVARNLLKW